MNLEEVKKWYIKKGKIFYTSIELTQRCNFSCKHCYCPEKNAQFMPYEDAVEIINKLQELSCFLLIFTGGEVFLHPDFLKIYTYAKERGFLIDIMTNGSLISEEALVLFQKLPPHVVSVTVYGTDRKDYETFAGNGRQYEKVMHSLKRLKECGIPFNIRTVATRTLLPSIANGSFDRLADGLSADFRYDPIIFPKVSGDQDPLGECLSAEEIAKLEGENTLRKNAWEKIFEDNTSFCWNCRAGVNSLAIDYIGQAHVCGLYREKGISVLENSMDRVLAYLKAVHEEHEKIVSSNECSSCRFRKICKWCPAYANVYNGNETEKVSFFCRLAEKRYEMFYGKENI